MGGVEERFWSNVVKTRECWNYQRIGTRGYGKILANGTHAAAHRISWELHFGTVPDGMFVCHKCDNRACVKPGHLFLGTHADNMADRNRKGRNAKGADAAPKNPVFGERHHNTILRNADIRTIRRLYAKGGISQQKLADRFGVDQTSVSRIIRRAYWDHII